MKNMIKKFSRELEVVAALAVIMVVFGVIQPIYFSPSNLLDILDQSVINGLLAIGMTLSGHGTESFCSRPCRRGHRLLSGACERNPCGQDEITALCGYPGYDVRIQGRCLSYNRGLACA